MARKDEKKPEAEKTEAKDAAKVETKVDSTEAETQPIPVPTAAGAGAPAAAKDQDKELPAIEPPAPKGEPWPDATPEPMRPVAPAPAVEPTRARTDTAVMPQVAPVGVPPEMPKTTAPPPPAKGSVETPTHMPSARDVPSGNPDDPAPAPGLVPPGDSRSLRRGKDFALIYRQATFVISRFGAVGTRGQWRVVEYPTSSAASHAYAKECSRFVSEGFSDYRE